MRTRITRSWWLLLAALAALALLAGACSGTDEGETDAAGVEAAEQLGDGAGSESDTGEAGVANTVQAADQGEKAGEAAAEEAVTAASAEGSAAEQDASGGGLVPSSLQLVDFGRDIIFTAQVSVEVPDVGAATLQAVTAVQSLGGLVFGQQTSTQGSPTTTLVFKVPSAQFQQALADIGKVGFVLSQQISADDVTERVVDLQSRIITAEASVLRLRKFLDGATDLNAIAQLEAELLRRETDLELLRGQLRTVEQQVSLATLTLTITQKVPGPEVQLTETFLAGGGDGTADAACPGAEELTVFEGDPLTLCFEMVNTGDTFLADITLTDVAFGVDSRDVLLVSGDLDAPLAPGGRLVFSAVTESTTSRAAQGRVQATPVDEAGNELGQAPVADGSDVFLTVEPDDSLPGFLSGLDAGWDLLVRVFSVLVLALGFALPFAWVLPLAWYLRRRFPRQAKAAAPRNQP